MLYLLQNLLFASLLVGAISKSSITSLTLKRGDMFVQNGIAIDWVARATYTDEVTDNGWGYLEVETSTNYPDMYQSYAAGFIEGVATHKIIYKSWRNTQDGFCSWHDPKFCDNLRVYLRENIDWMKNQIHEHYQTSSLWYQVDLILSQMVGLSKGYNSVSEHPISEEDFLLMNLSGDVEDLSMALSPKKRNRTLAEWVELGGPFKNGHCSAIIKLLPGNEDLLVSHVTWNSYQSMLRILKKYILPYRQLPSSEEIVPGKVAAFSSYPAYLGSGDDFYLLSSGLTTLETTIGNSNPSLWSQVKSQGQLQEWIRVIAANRLAKSGEEWSKVFKQYNSGTYNNQWMVVDYKKFKPGQPLRPDTLWIIEQLPGYIQDGDQTTVLTRQTYWPSYNTPFYRAVYNLSGLPAYVEKYGDWFSYDRTPRALIFKRDHSKVTDMHSLIKLMRYNDYQHDSLSRCNCTPPFSAENAISARNDLNPKNGTYPFGALGHRSHGGTDVKATSSKLFMKLDFVAMNGPTYDQQPVFKWSEQDFQDTPHFGHPDAWKFPLVQTKWLW